MDPELSSEEDSVLLLNYSFNQRWQMPDTCASSPHSHAYLPWQIFLNNPSKNLKGENRPDRSYPAEAHMGMMGYVEAPAFFSHD